MRVRTDTPSGFGAGRASGRHGGADYLGSYGIQNVTAADQGEVDRVGEESEGNDAGNFVQLAHRNADGQVVSYTLYAHLADAPNLRVGQVVQAGQVIGGTGNSGNAVNTPTHVHFEIRTRSHPRGDLANRLDPVPQFGPRPMNLFDVRF